MSLTELGGMVKLLLDAGILYFIGVSLQVCGGGVV